MSEHYLHQQSTHYGGAGSYPHPQFGQVADPSGAVGWVQTGGYYGNQGMRYRAQPGGNATAAQQAGMGFSDDERPLLEELGIDPRGIWKSCAALLLGKMKSDALAELDGVGAAAIQMATGAVCLLTGKALLGPILGWSVLGCGIVGLVLTALAGPAQSEQPGDVDKGRPLSWYNVYCLIGYCSFPLLISATLGLLMPKWAHMSVWIHVGGAAWATLLATRLVCTRVVGLDDLALVAAYPIFLLYATVALLLMYKK